MVTFTLLLMLKKAKNINAYENAVEFILDQERVIEEN